VVFAVGRSQKPASATVQCSSFTVWKGIETAAVKAGLVLCFSFLGNGIQQIVVRDLSGLCYLCQQLVYLVDNRIFLIANKIGELLGSYQEHFAKSVGTQGEELVKTRHW
jgi:hypothetical protein